MRTATGDTAVTRARWAITAIFCADGLLIANLVGRVPSLKLDLGLSSGQLGLVSALFGVAAVVAMQATGRLAARVGSRPIVRLVILLLPLALVGVGWAPGIAQLMAAQLVFGAAQGMLDVTMNTHAVAVHLGASLGAATLGYLAFSACQTVGRLVGDRLLAGGSPARLLRLGTLTAAGGLAVVVLSPWAALGVVGLAVLGVGLATPLPVLFGVVGDLAANRTGAQEPDPAVMVARFATITFTGLLLTPAVIGWAAELVGLTWTLTALIPLLAVVASVAGVTSRPRALPAASVPSTPEPALISGG